MEDTGTMKDLKKKEIIQSDEISKPEDFLIRLDYALNRFDWGKSFLDADAIRILNEIRKDFRKAIELSYSLKDSVDYAKGIDNQIKEAYKRGTEDTLVKMQKDYEVSMAKDKTAKKILEKIGDILEDSRQDGIVIDYDKMFGLLKNIKKEFGVKS